MIRAAALTAIRFYRGAVSPWLPVACRFTPTCSQYAATAIEEHGVWRGGVLAARRLLRCRPFGGAGLDPCPPRRAHGRREGSSKGRAVSSA